jgi:branched-chain amino acid transport system ATP-binding protein
MPTDDQVLVLDAWSVGYYDQPIVEDFSATFRAATVTTLIGGNGAGKSTLLKSIFGLNKRFGGQILFRGKPVHRLSPAERLASGIGIVPQGRCNFPAMSVRENLEMGAYLLPKRKVAQAIESVIALFPMLKRKWSVAAGYLSGGEQQILETAMVLETGPSLLLLDEPSLGLSPKMQAEVFEMVAQLRSTGVTVIMAEQNAYGSLMISDNAIVLSLGRKFMEGPAREVMYDSKIRTAFLGGGPQPDSPVH